MKNLMKFEFRKLMRQKSLYILLAVQSGMIVLSILAVFALTRMVGELFIGLEGAGLLAALGSAALLSGKVFLVTALSSSNVVTILAIGVALFVCGDFTSDTMKDVLSRGYSRVSVLAAKYAATLVCTVAFCVAAWAVAFILSSAIWGVGDGWSWDVLRLLLSQCLILCAYGTLFFTVSMLTKKTGGAIALGILVPMVASLAALLIDVFVNHAQTLVQDFLLPGLLSAASSYDLSPVSLLKGLWCPLGYIAAFLGVSVLAFRRSEV